MKYEKAIEKEIRRRVISTVIGLGLIILIIIILIVISSFGCEKSINEYNEEIIYRFEGFNIEEINEIWIEMLYPLKSDYLENIKEIVITKNLSKYNRKGCRIDAGGLYYEDEKKIIVEFYDKKIDSIIHATTICHELLHHKGFTHNDMNGRDIQLECYNFTKLNQY